jgi:hypothetical protein
MAVLGTDAENADRRHEHGGRPTAAEQLDAHVPLRTIDHHARDQTPALERGDVQFLSPLVAATPCDIGQNVVGQRRAGFLLEQPEIDGKLRLHAVHAPEIDFVLVVAEYGHRVPPGNRVRGLAVLQQVAASWERIPFPVRTS